MLTGALPAELGNLGALQYLDLSHNYLSGRPPDALRQLKNLQHFDLSHNLLAGDLYWDGWHFGDFPALIYLDFSYNRLGFSLPEGLDRLTALTHLDLSDNRFDSEIPWELGTLPNLVFLSLADNQLSGVIPSWLGNLGALTYLDLHNNLLTGVIPAELGHLGGATKQRLSTVAPKASLSPSVSLDLSSNHLIGAIPAELGQNAYLSGLQLSGNQLSGSVPIAVVERLYTVLDLNYNQLIPTDPRWRDTQTVAPTELLVTATGDAVTLNWTPIRYTDHGGFYEVSYATAPGGPFTVAGHTVDKGGASYVATDMAPAGVYYFRVRTFTPAHSFYSADGMLLLQQSNLWSDYTPLVSVNVAATATPMPTAIVTPTPTGTPCPTSLRLFLPLVWR